MTITKTIEVQTREDGELFIELPQDILDAADLKVGDVVEWKSQEDGSYILTKKPTQWVLVEAVSMFRMRYMVQVPVDKAEWALDTVVCQEAKEFSQKHLDETIVSHRIVSREEALQMCKQDNKNTRWSDEKLIDCYFTTMKDEE